MLVIFWYLFGAKIMSRPEQYCYYWYHYHYYPRLRMLTTRSRVRATLHSSPRSTLLLPYSCISSRSSLYYSSLLYGHLVDGHPSHTIQYNYPAVLLHISSTPLYYICHLVNGHPSQHFQQQLTTSPTCSSLSVCSPTSHPDLLL